MSDDAFDASHAFNGACDEEYLIVRQLFFSTAVDDVIQAGRDLCYLAEDVNSEIVFVMPQQSHIALAEEKSSLKLLERAIYGYLIGQHCSTSPSDETVTLMHDRARTMSYLLWDHALNFVEMQIKDDLIPIIFEDKTIFSSTRMPQSVTGVGLNYDQVTINSMPVNEYRM